MKSHRNIGRTDRRIRFPFSFLILVLGLWLFNGASGDPLGLSISIFSGIIMITALAAYCPVLHLLRLHSFSEEELKIYGHPYHDKRQILEA
ncbi:YgaP family membrane protein [Croceimicrobium hydrocarbonivorans]|uniref:DUF2892 domain-containing protein n=1 Tax=Croceimicrobium hydrocarbonivorans TaxID=2761580 RepID=A0A7H0VF15_9FLAO|nr:DUF2892 domain-containing protein [Croceimicrobium hydrocarbonivorans]QNR24313.1 DUF2892 domain-containing protein [Croceimicrobium hydrocarbonivorans]